MKKHAAIVLILLTQLALAGPESVNSKLQAMYDKADTLKTKKDVAGLGKFLTETRTSDFVFFAKSGRHTLKDLIQGMSLGMKLIDKVSKATVHIDKLTVTGSTALATTTTIFVFITHPLEDHHAHVLSEQIVGEDTWIKANEGWKLKQSKSTSEHFFRDGRPYGS